MNDLTAMCKECCNFLIRSTFIKGEPITGRLMVDTKQYTSKRAKILCDRNNMIIGKGKTGVMDNKNDGIAIRDCSQQVVVKNNTISKSSRCGIMVFENSNVKELSVNQISKVGECGIRVYGESSVTNAIQNNHIKYKRWCSQ